MVSRSGDGDERLVPLGSNELDRIYRTEAPRLARYFRKRLRNGQDAVDLVQDAFLRLASSAPASGHRRPAAYLQRIARNLLIDRARKIVACADADHVPIDSQPDIGFAPEQAYAIEVADVVRLYRLALAALPERTRTVFLCHRVEEMTYAQIARRLGISVPTVQYHVARALAHIDRALDPE